MSVLKVWLLAQGQRGWRAATLALAIGTAQVALAAPSFAGETLRGYVTQIAAGRDGVRVWVAPEKGIKGRGDVLFDVADPLVKYMVALARDSLKLRLPVKVKLSAEGVVQSFVLRVYPSKKQKVEARTESKP